MPACQKKVSGEKINFIKAQGITRLEARAAAAAKWAIWSNYLTLLWMGKRGFFHEGKITPKRKMYLPILLTFPFSFYLGNEITRELKVYVLILWQRSLWWLLLPCLWTWRREKNWTQTLFDWQMFWKISLSTPPYWQMATQSFLFHEYWIKYRRCK